MDIRDSIVTCSGSETGGNPVCVFTNPDGRQLAPQATHRIASERLRLDRKLVTGCFTYLCRVFIQQIREFALDCFCTLSRWVNGDDQVLCFLFRVG